MGLLVAIWHTFPELWVCSLGDIQLSEIERLEKLRPSDIP